MPTGLFKGMIAPLTPFSIRGVIWYQGEANTWWAWDYAKVFRALITGWRRQWGQGDLPFLFVQLANYRARVAHPGPSNWAELREAQSKALSLPGTGMAVAIDVGEADSIHPRNKQEVGYRLSLIARALVYGEKIACHGPRYRAFEVEGRKVRIFFDPVDGGLATRDGCDPTGFTVPGEGERFRWAQAEIDGDTVVVWNGDVDRPADVRYGWAANPECNLVNGAGLPAAPFRTDDRPAISDFW
jgi:sialate O-acetylesterase